MSQMRRNLLLLSAVLTLLTPILQAHTVPSLGLEVEVISNKHCRLLVDMDPRLFLSKNPTSLPPVGADWFRALTEDEVKKAQADASAFLSSMVSITIGGKVSLEWKYTATDGATNKPLSAEATEVHFLAEGLIPAGAGPQSFQVSLHNDCAVALTMIAAVDGAPEKRPQVLFPGETSRAINWKNEVPSPPPTQSWGGEFISTKWPGVALVIVLLLLLGLRLLLRK